jgi:NhaP-type Na+/H+ or K+/H+ antiporter
MNDGAAFPFTWLAIALAAATGSTGETLWHWAWMDVLYRIAAGVLVGWGMGRMLAYLVITFRKRKICGNTRWLCGCRSYTAGVWINRTDTRVWFIAVFVTAIALRNSEMHHKYHKKLHSFTDQIEKILVAIVLILLGGAAVSVF